MNTHNYIKLSDSPSSTALSQLCQIRVWLSFLFHRLEPAASLQATGCMDGSFLVLTLVSNYTAC